VHAPCHVTCTQGIQNDHIFGIPKAYCLFTIQLQWGYDDD